MSKFKAKWIKYPIATTKDCNILLQNGYTLLNATGGQVSLSETGEQVVVQLDKRPKGYGKKSYRFSNPQCWQVVEPTTGLVMPIKITFMMKVWWFMGAKVL